MNRAVPVALLVVALIVATASPARACSCVGPNPACQAFWTTDTVFDGRVVAIEAALPDERLGGRVVQFPEKLVTLDVAQTWKGAVSGRVQVATATTGPACGFNFKVGKRYIVFANERSMGRLPEVSSCTNTRLLADAGDLPEFLDSLSRPATGGRVFGTVKLYERSKSSGMTERPFDLAIRLAGDGVELTTRSLGGSYEFGGLPVGSYDVTATVPEGYAMYGGPSRSVEILDVHGCAETDYGVTVPERVYGGPVRR
jgi:hypothetical protein